MRTKSFEEPVASSKTRCKQKRRLLRGAGQLEIKAAGYDDTTKQKTTSPVGGDAASWNLALSDAKAAFMGETKRL